MLPKSILYTIKIRKQSCTDRCFQDKEIIKGLASGDGCSQSLLPAFCCTATLVFLQTMKWPWCSSTLLLYKAHLHQLEQKYMALSILRVRVPSPCKTMREATPRKQVKVKIRFNGEPYNQSQPKGLIQEGRQTCKWDVVFWRPVKWGKRKIEKWTDTEVGS